MSGVKRYDLQQTGLRTASGDPLPKSVVAECDYDALSQRCRELEAQRDAVRSMLDERDMYWLRRFQECCEDPDAGGHDLPKSAVRDLQLVGALRNVGFGRSEITKFGEYLLAGGAE